MKFHLKKFICRFMLKFSRFYPLTISAKHSILDVWQGSDCASGLLKLLCCGSKRDKQENWYMPKIHLLQTKNVPLFWGQSTSEFDVFVLCFIFFIPLSQTISVINRNDMCYFLHASKYNSGACGGMCTWDLTHQTKKTATMSQREQNALTCFHEKVHIINVKMETSFHLPACLPAPILAIVTNTKLTNLWWQPFFKAKNEGISKNNFWISQQNLPPYMPLPLNRQTSISKQ